ncbi:putative RNA-binding Zn ribbon-like protein [Saccharomonospora amisosensis]|uniref:Putative RNA-binding Zn ribbon-like protein n=1 Tax=Saccharomonospora amisosensis TaxID=1128677 RepID=A0A7X5ZR24_9PSEU|nr:CGNR zinc finger domain-containing protein [Saccharomonospora amisosensis]NIJ12101.1 putative RNA-binding Zn ribbon-like protein [Saccharomonospora amisosensis]
MAGLASSGLILRSHTGARYRFDPGALCLELTTTGGPGEFRRFEVLHTPADLAAWAARSRLSPTPDLDISQAEVDTARTFRDALFRAATARATGVEPVRDDLDVINRTAAHLPLTPAVGPDGKRSWAATATGAQLLSTVARDAVELLTGEYAHRIRVCSGERCHLVFVDTSRPGSRRWCSMEHCGNQHKVRALRERRGEKG